MEGKFKNLPEKGCEIQPIREENRDACAALCQKVTGFNRVPDHLAGAACIIKDQRVTAFTLNLSTDGYSVAETQADMRELMQGFAAQNSGTLSCLMPTRNSHLFHWCLKEGFKIRKPLNLMVKGDYQPPNGCYFPNLLY